MLFTTFKKICFFAFSFFLTVGLLISPNTFISAQSNNRGLIVSPIISDIDVEKGQSYDYTIELANDTDNYNYNIEILTQTFIPSENDGVPQLSDFTPENDYAFWLNFEKTRFAIEKGEKVSVKAQLTIPSDAQAGGYYFAIVFSDSPDAQGQENGILIEQRIAALLFVNVKGQVEKDVKFTKIETNQKIIDPILDAISLKYTISLQGGAYIKPSGNIYLDNGSRAGVDLFPLNPEEKIVLPNSSRTFGLSSRATIQIPYLSAAAHAQETMINSSTAQKYQPNWSKPIFGNQKIKAEVIFVDSGGKIAQETAETEVFYFPWKILTILILFSGFLFVIFLRKRPV